MKKYRLIKELPWIEAGTEFIYNVGDGRRWVELVWWRNIWWLLDFIKAFWIDNDFFEPIEEKKTFDDLKHMKDKVWCIDFKWDVACCTFSNMKPRSETFLTREEAEDEHKRREWANRKDKFFPQEWEKYWYPDTDGRPSFTFYYSSQTWDILRANSWLCFRTWEKCEDAIKNSDIVRLFYTIR